METLQITFAHIPHFNLPLEITHKNVRPLPYAPFAAISPYGGG